MCACVWSAAAAAVAAAAAASGKRSPILLVGENSDSAVRVLRPDERAGAVAVVCAYCARHGRCVYIELSASGRVDEHSRSDVHAQLKQTIL